MSNIAAALIFLGISFCLSCADNQAVRLRYQAEKKFHQAEKHLRDYQARPGNPEPDVLRKIANSYRDLIGYIFLSLDSVKIETHPQQHGELTYLAFQSSTRLSQLYYSSRQFDSSIAITTRLLAATRQQPPQIRRTRLNLGRTLQASGRWGEAKKVYQDLIATIYPPADENSEVLNDIFGLPAHIFRVTNYVYGAREAQGEYQQAVKYYQTLASDYPETNLAAPAHASLYRLYKSTGKWQAALDELAALDQDNSDGKTELRLKMADIYLQGLNKPVKALKIYNDILKLSELDSLVYPAVRFMICQVKLKQAKPAEARTLLVELKRDYPAFYSATPSPQLAMAQAFEYDGKWNRAEIEYKLLIEKYPGSEKAMATYLHIADYLADAGRDRESDYWLDQAAKNYDQLISRGAGGPVEAKAMIFKADLLIRRAQPAEASELLVELFEKFPDSDPGRRAMLQAVRICREDLGDDDRAESLLQTLRAAMTSAGQGYKI